MSAAHQQQLALACRELADEIARGPSFFDGKGQLTDAVQRYTGARLTQNTERCALVAALKLLRYSDRQIAEIIKCDVRSIPLMTAEIEKSGAIPALKERLTALVGANAEQSSIAVGQLLHETLGGERSLELAAMIKAVGQVSDFMTSKFQLLTGAPTEIRAQVGAAAKDEVEAWAKANAILIEPVLGPVESESTAAAPNPQQIATVEPAGHHDDTDQSPTDDGPTGQPANSQEEGGGVSLPPPGGKP